MESAFGWTQIARSDVAKAAALLRNEERGVRDEIGFLSLHQGFADRFFPGTSVLQTRLRYALFVAWQIEDLEQEGRASSLTAEQRLRNSERKLVIRLINEDRGVIGLRSANYDPDQPPSTIYWTALRVWGILNPSGVAVWPGRGEVLSRIDAAGWSEERTAERRSRPETTFFALPERPAGWSSNTPLQFRLRPGERRYLCDRIEQVRRIAPGSNDQQSLLARLAKSRNNPHSWAQGGIGSPVLKKLADKEDREALDVALAAAALAHVGRAAYSALVERLAKIDGCEIDSRFSDELAEAVQKRRQSALSCDLDAVEGFIGSLETRFRTALGATLEWLQRRDNDVMELWGAYSTAEQSRKGPRARLPRTTNAERLRRAWIASNPPEAEPLNYRWHRVGVLLDDLHGIHG